MTCLLAAPDSPVNTPGAAPAQQQAELQKKGYISGSSFPDAEASKSASDLGPPRAGYIEAPDSKPLGKAKAEEGQSRAPRHVCMCIELLRDG